MIAILFLGAIAALVYGIPTAWSTPRLIVLMGAAALVILPAARNPVANALERLRDIPPRRRIILACGIGVAASVILLIMAVAQGRGMYPKSHDEQMHLVQMRMLSVGRLWMPPHALPDFLTRSSYSSGRCMRPVTFPGRRCCICRRSGCTCRRG